MSRILKVLLSCLIGSGIGTFVALSVNSWFWWTGCLAGGLVGYLSYEFKKVIAAVPRAWRAVSNWKPDKFFWRAYLVFGGFLLQIIFSSWFVIGLFVTAIDGFEMNLAGLVWIIILGLIVSLSFAIAIGGVVAKSISLYDSEVTKSDLIHEYKKMYRSYNILVGVYRFIRGLILFIRSLPRVFWRILKAYGRLCILIGRFFKKFFLLIHSEIRLLCAVDSLVGVVAGYIISQAYSLNLLAGVLVGMAAGALLGLANYQIFSVWILKLAPKKE